MKKFTEEELKGKFVLAFDTMCDGWGCLQDGDENPVLFDSADEAFIELFDGNLSMLENRSSAELKEFNEGVTKALVKEMSKIFKSGDVSAMRMFLDKYPECNDNEDWVEPAEIFMKGRKAIFVGGGIKITGEKL
jgi:hypothetical protein